MYMTKQCQCLYLIQKLFCHMYKHRCSHIFTLQKIIQYSLDSTVIWVHKHVLEKRCGYRLFYLIGEMLYPAVDANRG